MYRTRFFILFLVTSTFLFSYSKQYHFLRTIEAVGFPYYKILMSLGDCKADTLFFERKVWPRLRLNRVLDIYYKSNDSVSKVSRVEIMLVVNDTACDAYSNNGVGFLEFAATLFFPTNMATIFSTLTIYTCNKDKSEDRTKVDGFKMMPFYLNPMMNDD